ncbi:peroxide stress protein YaaA [Hydrogenobaculum acidophilum]
MRVLYLTRCANKFSAYSDVDCKEDLFKDGKFSFLEKRRKEAFKLLKAKKPKEGGPLWRIYKDKFWEGLHMHVMPKAVKERIFERTIVLHPIMGMLSPEDKVCKWEVSCQYKNMSFWKEDISNYISNDDFLVFNFLPASFEKLLPKNIKLVSFKYTIKDRPMKDSSLAKAYTMRYIVEKDITSVEAFKKINFLDFVVSDVKEEGQNIVVHMISEGKYSVKKAGII